MQKVTPHKFARYEALIKRHARRRQYEAMYGRSLAVVPAFAIGTAAATNWTAEGLQWWKHVEYLASDELDGREPGTAGYEKAANYVAGQFEEAGLKPGGSGKYF